MAAYTANHPAGDFDGSGAINIMDVSAYFSEFNDTSDHLAAIPEGWLGVPGISADSLVGYDGYWFDVAGAADARATGLYAVRHRAYDPGKGRWMQRDPAGYVDGMNSYEYVSNRPVAASDPLGLWIYRSRLGKLSFDAIGWVSRTQVGADLSIFFKADSNFPQKSCCTSVGFIQIYKANSFTRHFGNWGWVPFVWHADADMPPFI
jgi:RHS repeat-associated protein